MPWQQYGPRRGYEMILFATKGKRVLKGTMPDVIQVVPEQDRKYAAQKPYNLYHALLSYTLWPGDEVLDPCCGSGPVFLASAILGMKATGIEKDETGYGLAASMQDRAVKYLTSFQTK